MNPCLFEGVKRLCPDRDPQDLEQAVQDLKLPASQTQEGP